MGEKKEDNQDHLVIIWAEEIFLVLQNMQKILVLKKLSVYAFSTENWKRPEDEVNYLMTKPIEMYHENKHRIDEIDYKVVFSGRRDHFSKALIEVIDEIEEQTKSHEGFTLNICVDYGIMMNHTQSQTRKTVT